MNYRHIIGILTWLSLITSAQAVEMVEECIAEPVFKGEVCLYQANREAEQTILLVHGIGDNASRDWSEQLEPLAQYYRVVTFDLPGFGRSEQGDKRYTPEHYAALIDFIADHYQLAQFDLLGHSMGGAVSLLYAAHHPQRVRRLVLADVAGVLHRLAIGKYVIAGSMNGNHDEAEETESYVVKVIEKFERFFGLFRNGVAEQSEHARAGIELVDYDFSSALKLLSVPTLLVWGRDDRVAPLRTAQVLLYRISDVRLALLDGAGHVSMREQSERFNALLLQFLLATEPTAVAEDALSAVAEQEPLTASCQSERGKSFSGRFSRLEIKNCSGVVIQDAVIDELTIFESRVVIERSRIGGEVSIGLDSIGSDIKVTASLIEGDVAMRLARSRLDLAAVDLQSKKVAIESVSGSRVIFSVSTVANNERQRTLHESVTLDAGEAL